jgi:mRNA-degrading endonuclease RelE of RelBE toxin-antitoxin system
MRDIFYKPAFEKVYKKLKLNQVKDVNIAIKTILEDSSLGDGKVGDLDGVTIYKFKMVNQLTLLAYQYDDEKIVLLQLGSHQNFYNELKRCPKNN